MLHNKEIATRILTNPYGATSRPFSTRPTRLCEIIPEHAPAGDPRIVPLLLECDPVKEMEADALTARMIDNSIVDQLLREKFIQRQFAKEFR